MNRLNKDKLVWMYETMVKIRAFENEISHHWPEQEMRSPPHMYAGREAMATGVCAVLKPSDQVVGYYRGHGYYLAKGGDPKSFMSELYCKETGSNEGKGGSMLISSPKVGYVGSSAIVAGGIPIATGLAFGNKFQGFKKVVVCFLGDAATEEGVFYESLNFAALKKLPIIYVCEKCGKIGTTFAYAWDPEKEVVKYRCSPDLVDWARGCGHEGEISPYDGNGKLPWKVEWAAKWPAIGVAYETAGKDYG